MELIVDINGQKTPITLTSEQIAQVKRSSMHYTDIKTVEDAFNFSGLDYSKWLESHEDMPEDILAYAKLRVIVKAINGGKVMNYKDTGEYKYYPWFNAVGSSAGFSFGGCGYVRSYSGVGSRLCFIDSDRAQYAGKQFIEVYNQFINPTE